MTQALDRNDREAGSGGPDEAEERRLGWRAPIALLLAVLWLGGLGSAVAVIVAASALRRGPRSSTERALLVLALVLGVAGILLTIVSFVLLASSTTTSEPDARAVLLAT